MFWGKFTENFLPSVPWRVESSKIFKQIKKFSKFQKCPKSFPKVSKRVLNLFWVKFFEKNFCPVFRGGSSFRKFSKKNIFKIPKRPKIIPKSIQTCFEHVLGRIFRKTFCPVFHGDFENFQKNISKFHKCPKVFPKVSKRVLNLFWVKFFEKFFCPVFRGGSSLRKFSKKFKKCENSNEV